MQLPTVADLKVHLNLTSEETDFDSQCQRNLSAAAERVIGYLNRPVYETVPAEPAANYIVINDSINRGILEIAGYYLDAKGAVNADIINNMLEAFVGLYRLPAFS